MAFYVTLSSCPTSGFPYNKPNRSQYFLHKPIELDGEYEVALVQSVFKNVFNNKICSFKIIPFNEKSNELCIDIIPKDGESFEDVINGINKKLKKIFEKIKEKDANLFNNQSDSPKINFNSSTLNFKITNSTDYEIRLEEVDQNFIQRNNDDTFKFISSHFYYPKHFFVSTNLIDDQIYGEEHYPLLTNICLSDIKSDTVCHNLKNPIYVKVKSKYINEIEIEYLTDLYIPSFLKGTIVSTLHFRKLNGF